MKKFLLIINILFLIGNNITNAQSFSHNWRTVNTMLKTETEISGFKEFLDTVEFPFFSIYSKILDLNTTPNDSVLIRKIYDALIRSNNYETNADTALLNKIIKMQENDQYARRDDAADEEMRLVDSINHEELRKIILEQGKIPGIKEIGNDGMLCVGILLRHIGDSAYFNFLHPYMISAAKNGDFIPEHIAGSIDYYWFACNFTPKDSTKSISYQLYGTMEFKLDRKRKIKIPVKNWEETERLRYELGMLPLKDEIDENPDIIYDLELFKKKFPHFQE